MLFVAAFDEEEDEEDEEEGAEWENIPDDEVLLTAGGTVDFLSSGTVLT
jgi:hypothetical protein